MFIIGMVFGSWARWLENTVRNMVLCLCFHNVLWLENMTTLNEYIILYRIYVFYRCPKYFNTIINM